MTRFIRYLVAATVTIAASLAQATDKHANSWEKIPDVALRAKLEELVGNDAIDCGFVDIRKRKADAYVKKKSLDCIAGAQASRKAFKFGIARLPLGRDAWEIFARTSSGQSWLLSRGQGFDEEFARSWAMRCAFVDVSSRTLLISGMDCGKARQLGKEAE